MQDSQSCHRGSSPLRAAKLVQALDFFEGLLLCPNRKCPVSCKVAQEPAVTVCYVTCIWNGVHSTEATLYPPNAHGIIYDNEHTEAYPSPYHG